MLIVELWNIIKTNGCHHAVIVHGYAKTKRYGVGVTTTGNYCSECMLYKIYIAGSKTGQSKDRCLPVLNNAIKLYIISRLREKLKTFTDRGKSLHFSIKGFKMDVGDGAASINRK